MGRPRPFAVKISINAVLPPAFFLFSLNGAFVLYNEAMIKKMQRAIIFLTLVATFAPIVPTVAAVPGDLVKGSLAAVYYVNANHERWAFPNETTYFTWYRDFSSVKIVSDTEIAALRLAGLVTIRPGVAPVKVASDTKNYAVAHGGWLRPLASDGIASIIYGADWKRKIKTIPEAFFASYKIGDTITAGGQYWWKNEMDAAPTIASNVLTVAPAMPSALSFTTVPRTTNRTAINLVAGLWNPHDPNVKATPTKETIAQTLFGGSGGGDNVKDFYAQTTGGAVELKNAGVFGWYDADKPASHYWATPDPTDADHDGFINGHNEKWAETILKIDKEFDFSQYDYNHDGVLTPDELGVLVVIPTNDPFGTNRVVYAQEFPSDKPMIVDGVKIGMIAEWYTGNPPNMGVVAHELSHLFFNTADMYLESGFRAGGLSLMDGSYCLCDIDPWQRLAGGKNWLDVLLPNGSGNYELSPVDAGYSVMKLARPGSDEFFLVEYRERNAYQQTGASGLLVWDILNSSVLNDWGRNNIHLLRANGGTPLDDALASYHGAVGAPVSTGDLKWFDGTSSGISLSEIGEPNATIKFKLNLP